MEKRYARDNKYYQEIDIPCYDTDASFRLKPASFMDLAQELAYWAASELGFGFDDLQDHGTAWVLSRMHIHVADAPRWRESVRLATWHKGLDGLFFMRDFRMSSPDGRERVACTSSWLVVDARTHHLVRSDRLEGLVQEETQCREDALPQACPKIQLPAGAPVEPCGSRTVSYSDIDILGHTNNARYIVWAMDALPYARTSTAVVKDIFINFNKETRPGDLVELFTVQSAEADYVEGRVDGHPVFIAQFLW